MKGADFFRRQVWVAMATVLVVVMAAIAAMVALTFPSFEAALAPQVREKAATAGRSLAGVVGRAAAYDLELAELVGVDELFREATAAHPEFARIELRSRGETRVASGPALPPVLVAHVPIPGYEAEQAEIAVTVDPGYVHKLFEEMALNLVVVAVVALFISLELLYFLTGALLADLGRLRAQIAAMSRGAFIPLPRATWVGRGLSEALESRARSVAAAYGEGVAALAAAIRSRAGGDRGAVRESIGALRELRARFAFTDTRGSRGSNDAALVLGAMRAPFFLLLLADDLSRSFLPLFAAGLPSGGLPFSANLVASLPIVVFMMVVALSQPVLGGWSERVGRRRSFLIGAAVALVAHALSAQAGSIPELLAWRSAGGAAWAIAFVAAQGYVLDHTDAGTRTTGLAAFVGIIMVSLVCGPSIGGILADGIGHRPTLALGAVLTALSLLLAWRQLPADAATTTPVPAAAPARAASAHLGLALANRRFLALLVFAAVPAKVILIAFCYYLIPLYIVGVGSTSAMAGRLIMLYSVMMVLLVPVMASWVVVLRARHAREPEAWFVAAGLLLSGLAGLAMALPLGLFSPLLVVALLGIGQALSISPQAAMVAEVCREEIRTLGQSTIYGVYRLVERIGNAAGPLIGALLLELAGFHLAFVAIGSAVLVCAGLFAVVFLPRAAPVVPQAAR